MHVRHYERGQVFPLWIGAIVTTLMFAFLAVNYGNTLRYQIRAQNAADAAAQGFMGIQAERFNQLNVALYGTGVEEYRLRHILNGIMMAANESGGCEDDMSVTRQNGTDNSGNLLWKVDTCSEVYRDLSNEYYESLNRYTADATLLNDYSQNTVYSNWQADVNSLLSHFNKNCNKPYYGTTGSANAVSPAGDDCGFTYTILSEKTRTGLLAVQQDAQNILVPGLGHDSTIANDTENANLFAPAEIDVTTCAKVPPLIPNFGPLHLASQYAIGRAAATPVMMEEDWLEPGAIFDPAGRPAQTAFQPYEAYTAFIPSTDSSETYNWYGVNFGGNAAIAYVNYGVFNQPTYTDEFSARLGWWNAIAIHPFATTPTVASICPS